MIATNQQDGVHGEVVRRAIPAPTTGEVRMEDVVAGASEQDLDQLTSLFRLVSDKTRLTILFLLAEGERNVTSLCEVLELPQPTVSHHLGLLRVNNVIGNRRRGKQVFYTLNGTVNVLGRADLRLTLENFAIRIGPRAKE